MTTELTLVSGPMGPGPWPVGDAVWGWSDLADCTKVPPERIGEFLDWPTVRLQREARHVSRILVRFARAVLDSMDSSSAAADFVRSLDLASISRDHDWRQIFCAIRDAHGPDEGLRRRALVRYLQYLSFRKRLLEFICARRQGLEETGSLSGLSIPQWTIPGRSAGGAAAAGADGAEYEALGREARAYRRLPLGETIEVALGTRGGHKLVLAGYPLYLRGTRPPTLNDRRGGATYRIARGRNLIGRHPENDIALDPRQSAISRAHLVLEWDGAEHVRLTDLSSAGTLLRMDEARCARSRPAR